MEFLLRNFHPLLTLYGEISLINNSSTRSKTHRQTSAAGSPGTRRPPEGMQRGSAASDVTVEVEGSGAEQLPGGDERSTPANEDDAKIIGIVEPRRWAETGFESWTPSPPKSFPVIRSLTMANQDDHLAPAGTSLGKHPSY
jgi:hypothetical protein